MKVLVSGFVLATTLLLSSQMVTATTVLQATMNGANEVPPNASPATGFATITLDNTLQFLTVDMTFSGLIGGPAAAAHIHCCAPPGVNAIVAVPFTGFPAATSGSYLNTFDLLSAATYNGAFITASGGTVAGAQSRLISNMNAGLTYTNIHDATFPGGEIRGQIVPEPATTAFVVVGGLLLALSRRRSATRQV